MIKDKLIEVLIAIREELSEIETPDKDQKGMSEDKAFIYQTIERIENTDITLIDYSAIPVLYILSILTYPHATFARYPNKTLPPDKYDETLGIVQHFPEITELLDEVINPLRKYSE